MNLNSPYLVCTDGARLGLGGAPLGNLFQTVSDETAQQVLNTAWLDGCRTFDTAPHYGHGLSEKRMGLALRQQARPGFKLSSKVGRLLTPSPNPPREQHGYVDGLPFVQHWDFSRSGIRKSIEDSLERLCLDRLDAVYLHDIDEVTQGTHFKSVMNQVLGEALPMLSQLKQEGLLTQIGLGVNDHYVALEVLKYADLDVLMLAGRYTLLDTSALPQLMPELIQRNVALALGGVFNSGILTTRLSSPALATFNYAPASEVWLHKALRIQSIADLYGVSLRGAALQFSLAHPAVHIVMLGIRSESEWLDARLAEKELIPLAFWDHLKTEGCIPTDAPTPT